jgi:hypothetical protein
MRRREFDVFLCYRHEGSPELAQGVRASLENRGFHVFLDAREMPSGPFPESLLRAIEEAPNFVALLTRDGLARCFQEDDWVRREIAHAIRCRRNIVPLKKADFEFPDGLSSLPDIARLKDYHCFTYSHDYHDECIDRICAELRRPATAAGREKRETRVAGVSGKSVASIFASALLVALLGSVVLRMGRSPWFNPAGHNGAPAGSAIKEAPEIDAQSGSVTGRSLKLVGQVLENSHPFSVRGQIPRDYHLALVDGQNLRFVGTIPVPAYLIAFAIGADGALQRLEASEGRRTTWDFPSRLDDRPGTEFLCLATSNRPFTEQDWEEFARKCSNRDDLRLPRTTILYGDPMQTRVFGGKGELTKDQLRNLIPGNAPSGTWWQRIEKLRVLLRDTFEDFRFLAFAHRPRTAEDP